MEHRTQTSRGGALIAVIVTALIASVAAFAALMMAMSQSQSAKLQQDRLVARYAAEAGLVWAQQQLWDEQAFWSNPAHPCTDPGTEGTNVVLTNQPLPGIGPVNITITNCGVGRPHKITAKVSYL